jgi:Tol biopolymer transport system component
MSRRFLAFLCLSALVCASISCLAADRIVLDRLGPAQAGIYVSNADGSGQRILQNSGSRDYDPSWSPKGDWIVFTSERTGPAELYRIHPDGSGLKQLTTFPAYTDQAAFSPDEKQVVYVSTRAAGRANLWILDLASGKSTRLTTGDGGDFRPSWSPDGKWIAFSSDRGSDLPAAKGRWERLQVANIYIIHPDGSGLKRISDRGGFCGSPKWTADSKSVVAYCMSAQDTWTFRAASEDGNDDLVKIDIATGKASPVAAGQGVKLMPTVLNSGKIAYLRQDKSAHGVFYEMGKPGPAGWDLRTPSWSPDGNRVVYSRFAYKFKAPLVKQWSPDKNFEVYSTGMLPGYDRSGEHLAITKLNGEQSEAKPNGDGTTLLVMDNDKPAHAILTRKDLILAPSWSPDARQIVVGVGEFSAFMDFEVGNKKPVDPVNGGAQVAILNADGSGFHLVTSGPDNNAFPSFAPDGKQIVYRTSGPEGDGLRIMNLEEHSVKVLTDNYDNFPEWSPRGNLIAFMRRINGFFEIMTIHPDGTGLKQLTYTKGNEAHIAWSPDGERILFTSSRMGFKDEVLYENNPQPYGEIFVMRYDGAGAEQLTDDQWEEGAPAWQPQERTLASKLAH